MKENKPLLFSVTAADCDWSYTKGTGAGGQKRNKTSSAVHCTHRASKAHGYSEGSRSQHENKREAFLRMSETKEFKEWHKLEIMRRTGEYAKMEAKVKQSLAHVKTEIRVDGKWTEVSEKELT
jgi:protein subunit release factor B